MCEGLLDPLYLIETKRGLAHAIDVRTRRIARQQVEGFPPMRGRDHSECSWRACKPCVQVETTGTTTRMRRPSRGGARNGVDGGTISETSTWGEARV